MRLAAVALLAAAVAAALLATRSCARDDPAKEPTHPIVAPAERAETASGERSRRPHGAAEERETTPADETPANAPPAPAPISSTPSADGRTVVVVEVVDESGAAVPGAIVRFWFSEAADSSVREAVRALVTELHATDESGAVSFDVSKDADGVRLQAYGTVHGFPPLPPVEFDVHAGCVERIRLVAARARTAVVVVVDETSDQPIAGARVVSVTEEQRRRRVGDTPASASVADADGRCTVSELSAGTHDFRVNADRYRQASVSWTGRDLRVRLRPHDGSAKIVVKVLGPGGVPLAGASVELVGTDRVAKTDAEGRVVFEDTDPGFAMVSLEDSGEDGDNPFSEVLPRRTAETETEDGGTYELLLGAPLVGTSALETRLVRDDGSPLVGVELTICVGDDERTVKTDAAGVASLGRMPNGEYSAYASIGSTMWFFEGADLAAGGGASVTWTLGTRTVKGRLVTGADKRGVPNVAVWFRGKNTGSVHTDDSGAFELTDVLPGAYMVDARSDDAFAAPREVRVPVDGEVVVELVKLGRVAVRFSADDRATLRKASFYFCVEGKGVAGFFRPGTGDDDLLSTSVLPGRYEVDVRIGEDDDERSKRYPVEVKSGETSVVVVKAP